MKLVTSRYTICSDKIPMDFDGVKIAVLSDLHDTVHGANNERLLKSIDNEKPDLVIIAGDLVTAKNNRDYSSAIELLRKLASKYMLYYGYGNHEQKLNAESSSYIKHIKEMQGVTILDNSSASIIGNKSIRISGLSIERKFYSKGKKTELLVKDIVGYIGNKQDEFTILIAHNPLYFKTYKNWGAELVIAGHLHGGIVRLPFVGGVLSPQISLFPKYDKGLYADGDTTMIVSAGLGKHTIPVRLWNPGELVMIELKNKV